MTQQQADLPNNHGGVRDVINANATDAETRLAKADKCRMGFADINDTATQTTPISYVGGSGWINLTNDGLGSFSQNQLPEGVTSLFSANQFDFTELSLYDTLDIRLDLSIVTSDPNQVVECRLTLAYGTPGAYSIPFVANQYKTAGSHSINRYNGIYMGNADTLNNPGVFQIQSDGDVDITVNGWYVRAIVRGEAS